MLSYINRQNVHLYKYKFVSKLALLYNMRWKAQHVLDAEVCDVMLNLLCSFPALKMHQELLSRLIQLVRHYFTGKLFQNMKMR